MARKTGKEKEQAFLAKKAGALAEQSAETPYVPTKCENEIALEILLAHGFNASIKDRILYCECANIQEYNRYKSLLEEKCGRDGRIPFSFGASIGKKAEKLDFNSLID